jgi:small ligand-binding sensory domain FIST
MGKASRAKQERASQKEAVADALDKFRDELTAKVSPAFAVFTVGEMHSLVAALNAIAKRAGTPVEQLITDNAGDIVQHGAAAFYHQVQNAAEAYLHMDQLQQENAHLERTQQRLAAVQPTIALPNGQLVTVGAGAGKNN